MPFSAVPQPEQLWCPLRVAQGVATITPTGVLEEATLPALDDALRTAIGRADAIVLDLAGLTAIDLAGARMLLAVARRLGWGGASLTLESVPAHVDRALAELRDEPPPRGRGDHPSGGDLTPAA